MRWLHRLIGLSVTRCHWNDLMTRWCRRSPWTVMDNGYIANSRLMWRGMMIGHCRWGNVCRSNMTRSHGHMWGWAVNGTIGNKGRGISGNLSGFMDMQRRWSPSAPAFFESSWSASTRSPSTAPLTTFRKMMNMIMSRVVMMHMWHYFRMGVNACWNRDAGSFSCALTVEESIFSSWRISWLHYWHGGIGHEMRAGRILPGVKRPFRVWWWPNWRLRRLWIRSHCLLLCHWSRQILPWILRWSVLLGNVLVCRCILHWLGPTGVLYVDVCCC